MSPVKRGGAEPPGTAGSHAAPEDVAALHERARIFDGHNDLALRVLAGADPADRLDGGHLDLPRMREGGLDGGIFAVWVDPAAKDPLRATLDRVDRFRAWLERTPGVRPVFEPEDLGAALDAGEAAAVIGVEGGYAIEGDLEAVDRLHEAGVRCLTLTWMRPTAWADAAGAPDRHGGLTPLGERVVDRLQRLGVLVDVSHASDAATRDVLERAERPVVASHSGVRSVADHPRNLPDALLVRLAEGGGVIGINFFPGYLDARYGERFDELRRAAGPDLFSDAGREAFGSATSDLGAVGLDRVAEHAARAVELAGSGAVGLGSDFDGVPALPEGMRDVRDLPAVTAALLERGLGPATVEPVLGANLLRVLEETIS